MRKTLVGSVVVAAAVILGGCSGNDDASPPPASTTSPAPESSPSTSSPSAGSSLAPNPDAVDLATVTFPVSWQDALDKARAKFQGDVSKIELEQEEGRYAYKVELLSDTQKYAVALDARSGDVLSNETDDFDKDKVGSERQKKRVDLEQVVPLKQATDAAHQTRDGRIKKLKLEGTSGGAQYEFDIAKGGSGDGDYEVQVDAKTGKVTSPGG